MLRENVTLTARAERWILRSLCEKMPLWVSPDMLTLLGIIGAGIALLGYVSSNAHPGFVCVAVAGVMINWLGDSLDGSLARYRRIERPKYGFFLDHMTDTMAMALIAIGIGLSPYALMVSALSVLSAYYLMVILSMATCLVTGVFRIGYNGVGPTEIRLFIVASSVAAITVQTPTMMVGGQVLTVYDIIIFTVTLALIAMCLRESFTMAKKLAAIDPSGTRSPAKTDVDGRARS